MVLSIKLQSERKRKHDDRTQLQKMGGLIPAVVQDYKTGEVLMLAFMNQAAW